MQRKIYSQTLKRTKPIFENNLNEKNSDSWQKIKDIVVMLGAISGVLAGVLWLGGRFYAYGYFERMGIPLYFLSFSAGEYTEVYITTIIAFFASNLTIIVTTIISAAIMGIILWAIQKSYKRLKIRDAVLRIEKINNKTIIFSSVLIFLASFFIAYNNGDATAQYLLMNSRSATIYSSEMLPLGIAPNTNSLNQQLSIFEYKDLYLLTYNNGKYYFFREIDSSTCKPKQIFIVADNDLTSVSIGNSVSLPKCSVAP